MISILLKGIFIEYKDPFAEVGMEPDFALNLDKNCLVFRGRIGHKVLKVLHVVTRPVFWRDMFA